MKKSVVIIYTTLFILFGCEKYNQDTFIIECEEVDVIGSTYSKKDILQKMLIEYSKQGIPGIVIAIYTPKDGYWGGSSGFSKIETQTAMHLCNLQYLQSAAKMYTATIILTLYEDGRIDLDAPITDYLPTKFARYIDKANTMSVRNLLNHTSGMPDYLESPEYISYILQHPDHYFTSEELLGYIDKKEREFDPGIRYRYSNTNFHVLSLIADAVAGNHSELIQQRILRPLKLDNTFYLNIKGRPTLVNSYLDRFSTGIVENVSQLQQVSVSFSKGDDGIIATPFDAINFMRGLMEGKLLTDSSMEQMLTFVNDGSGKPTYGMGIFQIDHKGTIGYGHGGAGAGAGCGLYYFPDQELYIFLGTNVGTLVDGPIVQKINDLKGKVLSFVLDQ